MGNVPQIGANILYASQNGCVPDCVVATGAKVGGGTPTDNTTALNALLAHAGTLPAGAIVILDGGFAHKGLLIPGNVALQGTGLLSGLFLISGSNGYCVTNYVSNGQAATTNIAVRNMTINGNYPNNGSIGDFSAKGIVIYNCAGIRIENVNLINVTTFAIFTSVVSNIVVDGCTITSAWINGDGVHIGGNCSNIKIVNNTISTWDDGIALNAPETFSGLTGGPITDVEISNNVFINCLSMVRMYSSATGGAYVARVMISNNSGTLEDNVSVSDCVLFLGNGDTYADGLQTVSMENVTASLDASGYFSKINDDCGTIRFRGCVWDSPVGANAFIHLQTAAVAVSDLLLEDCTIYRSTRGSSAAFGMDSSFSGCTIKRLRINGFNIVNQSGESYSAIATLIAMNDLAITELVIDALDCTLITAIVDSFTNVGSVSGAGVLATGLNFPDSVMANGTPYLSATSPNAGKPCIKIGGTVYPYVFA